MPKTRAQQAIDALDPSALVKIFVATLDAVNGVDVPAANDANEDIRRCDSQRPRLIDEAKVAEGQAPTKHLKTPKVKMV
ncbi:hypothetical protein [Psychrobacter lutiphocae]|uniref:hypothetical protein n=1 Tax=Psychrobacter lutiphocae TaxID=540500 RepID=UPI001919603F|nr:hypothetical protein [Psychrobacter lutiphocae]